MVPRWRECRTALAYSVRIPRARPLERHLLVSERDARVDARGDGSAGTALGGSAMSTLLSLAPLLERFFTQHLMQQRQVSPHTISSYRDTFRQFLKFARQRLHKAPSALMFKQIDAPLV